MKTLDKIIVYLKALLFLSITVLWFAGADYDKMPESTLNVIVFCLIGGNLVLWSFYYIHKFCEVMKETKENDSVRKN